MHNANHSVKLKMHNAKLQTQTRLVGKYVFGCERNENSRAFQMVTYFVVQAFEQGEKGYLIPDEPLEAPGMDRAIAWASRLARTKAAVLAFSRTGDPSTGSYDDAVILFVAGEIPDLAIELAC